eukprot:CAMPEP_0169182412 /NCGR_PEP_ID=MMETSP1016-20121227/30_1 /TAXON_ID=342587 /ORGANISM="Karlodinium micrum, Strain CCMP2283" /LENGTH=351 /DNA_ID=CAMNT_0009257609 /DNA_START=8 /DNA_END=1061 /DNA_ORIENTATION=-
MLVATIQLFLVPACLANARQSRLRGGASAEITPSQGLAQILLSSSPAIVAAIPRSNSFSSVKKTSIIRRSAPPIASAADIIRGWSPFALSKIKSELGMEFADEINDSPVAGTDVKIENYQGSLVKWCSALQLMGSDVTISSLCGICTSKTDIPHIIAFCGISDGGIDLYIDWRPRADGQYDLSCATLADYPQPETRQEFAAASSRKDFSNAFYTEEVAEWREALFALDGATQAPLLTKAQVAALSASPMLVDLRLPLTEASATAAARACMEAATLWRGWVASAYEMKRDLKPGFKQTSTHSRDEEVARNHFGFMMQRYSALFGKDAAKDLVVPHAGPLYEAYEVGIPSNVP